MPTPVAEWDLDVERGPGWLLVKPTTPDLHLADYYPLADHVWSLLDRHFVYRLVLRLDEIPIMNSHLIGQLLLLYRRIGERGGLMRLCGLSPYNRTVLRNHGLVDRFPAYACLEEAVLGSPAARKPR